MVKGVKLALQILLFDLQNSDIIPKQLAQKATYRDSTNLAILNV